MLYLGSKYVGCYLTIMDHISKVTFMLEEAAVNEDTQQMEEIPKNNIVKEGVNPIVVQTNRCETTKKGGKGFKWEKMQILRRTRT